MKSTTLSLALALTLPALAPPGWGAEAVRTDSTLVHTLRLELEEGNDRVAVREFLLELRAPQGGISFDLAPGVERPQLVAILELSPATAALARYQKHQRPLHGMELRSVRGRSQELIAEFHEVLVDSCELRADPGEDPAMHVRFSAGMLCLSTSEGSAMWDATLGDLDVACRLPDVDPARAVCSILIDGQAVLPADGISWRSEQHRAVDEARVIGSRPEAIMGFLSLIARPMELRLSRRFGPSLEYLFELDSRRGIAEELVVRGGVELQSEARLALEMPEVTIRELDPLVFDDGTTELASLMDSPLLRTIER